MFWYGCLVATFMILSFIFNVRSNDTPNVRILASTMALASAIYVIYTLVKMGG